MTLVASPPGGARLAALLRVTDLHDGLAGIRQYVEEAGCERALVGLVDVLGERLASQTDHFPAAITECLADLAPALAGSSTGAPMLELLHHTGLQGTAAELVDGLFSVVVTDMGADHDERSTVHTTAVLALSRLGMLEHARRRADELARLQATAQGVATLLDLQDVLARIVSDAAALIGAASGELLLLDDSGTKLRVAAVSNLPADLLDLELEFGEGLASQAIRARQPLYVVDYRSYEHRVERLMERFDWGSIACSPLIVKGTPLGALNVHFAEVQPAFRQSSLELLAAFADHAAIAIDHARRHDNETRLAAELAMANEELSRSLRLQMRLTEQVVLDRGLSGIAEELAALLDHPVLIEDHLQRPVAGAAPDGSEAWTPLLAPRERARKRARSSDDALEAGSAPPEPPSSPQERLALPVRLGREMVACLVLPGERELAPVDRALAELAVSGVALEFAKLRAAREVEHRLGGEVALELITGSFASVESIEARCARLGYDLREPRSLLGFRVTRRPGASTDAAAEADLRRRALEIIRDDLARRAPGSMIVAHGELIVALAATRDEDEARDLAARMSAHVSARLADTVTAVGVGDRCTRAVDYAPAFALARDAVELMAKLGRADAIIGARELGAYQLLIKGSNRSELIAFARRTLGPLIDHDRRHGTDLLNTLRVFMDEGRVQRRAAERLIVHVNTIVYRLKRIEELLGVDLDDAAVIFDSMLALRVVDVVGEV